MKERLLVCGDRNWIDFGSILEVLRLFSKDTVVIEGEARGADTLARRAAEALGLEVLRFPAGWEKYGKAAGVIRNQQMLDEGKPTKVLAFHANIETSKGTKDMITRAAKAGIPWELYTS